MWFLWLCPIINCLQVTILLLYYKHVFSDMIGGPKNCFQQRLIFYFRLQFAINFFEDLVPLGDTGKAILIVSL